MMVLRSKVPLTAEMAERVRREFDAARLTGATVVVLGPEFDVAEYHHAGMAGPLVDFLAQLGDA